MSRYSGRYYKGASKDTKAEKRAEAEARQRESYAKAVPYVPAGPDSTDW